MTVITHDDWRSGRHVVFRLHAHIVLVPKYRKKVMTDRVSAELRSAFEDVCQRLGAEIEHALWGEHFWSPSYAVVSCGVAPLEVVKRYVEAQKSPNRKPGVGRLFR